MKIKLEQLWVRPVSKVEEPRDRESMQRYHDLGNSAKIGRTFWFVVTYGEELAALLGFSAAAWKCGVRGHWIGWNFRHQYDCLNLIGSNSRFLILPEWLYSNLGSKVLFSCATNELPVISNRILPAVALAGNLC